MTSDGQKKCAGECGRTFRGTVGKEDVVQIRREAIPLLNVGLYRLTSRVNAPRVTVCACRISIVATCLRK
eukprot:COSAG02_NODE_7230_length_3107_cov_2.893285_3_plen_70_part_00